MGYVTFTDAKDLARDMFGNATVDGKPSSWGWKITVYGLCSSRIYISSLNSSVSVVMKTTLTDAVKDRRVEITDMREDDIRKEQKLFEALRQCREILKGRLIAIDDFCGPDSED